MRDHHNELRVDVAETKAPARRFTVAFRVFDDGLGFRYELPDQPAITNYEISDELTEFTLADNGSAWWIAVQSPAARSLGAAVLRGSGQHPRQRADAAHDEVDERTSTW